MHRSQIAIFNAISFEWNLWHFDLAPAARLFGCPHETVPLQNPYILLDVLEIAVDHCL
jgi:hypothetical protein